MAKEGRARVVDAAGGTAGAVQKRAAAALEKNGWTMSAPVLAAFVRRVGTDVGTAMRELEKLFAYTGGAEPTAADVAEICTVSTDGEIWEIQDVFGRRDLAGTLATVAKLLSNKGVKEIALLIMLETRLLDLALLADARERGLLAPDGRSWSPALGPADRAAVEALGKADVLARPSFLRGSIVEQSRLWSGAQVRAARVALMHAHERLVGSGSAEDRAILDGRRRERSGRPSGFRPLASASRFCYASSRRAASAAQARRTPRNGRPGPAIGHFNVPTLFTIEGFRFFFYSNDHLPVHVHVQYGGGEAAFEIGESVVLRESAGMKIQELRRAEEIVLAHRASIEEKWHETFG